MEVETTFNSLDDAARHLFQNCQIYILLLMKVLKKN